MAFVKKTWKDRIAEFPTRRRLTKEDNTSELVTVAREEGTLSQEGDAFSAENMNDLENRIDAEFTEVNGKIPTLDDVCAKKIGTEGNYATFRLKKAEIGSSSVSSRYTAFLVLCDQSAEIIGVYAIGVNDYKDMITKIAGTDATISRNGDNVTVTFSGKNYIYSNGLLFAPRDVI